MEASFRTVIGVLVSLFAFSCLVSMSAMELTSTLLLVVMLYVAFRWREQSAPYKLFNFFGFDWIFLIWLAVIGLGFALNAEVGAPWLEKIAEFRWIFVLYIIIAIFRFLQPKEESVVGVCIALLLVTLYSLVAYLLGFDPARTLLDPNHNPVAVGGRVGGFFNNPMTFAHSFQLIFCVLFGVSLYQLKWRDQKLKWLIPTVIFLGLALLLTFTRGVWISLALTIPIMGFIFNRKMGVILFMLVGVSYSIMMNTWPEFKERVEFVFDWQNNYDSQRVYLWKTNLKIFESAPVLGIGYGENGRRLREFFDAQGAPIDQFEGHAHNQYLHFLAGTGALGLTIYLLFISFFLFLSIRTFRAIPDKDFWEKGLVLGSMGAQIAFHIGGLTESNFEHLKVKYVLCFVWAIVVWLAYEYRVLRD